MKEIFRGINQYLLFGFLAALILYHGKTILVPVAFGGLLAMLMAPVCNWLEGKGFNRGFATLTCLLIIVVVIGGVIAIIGAQFSSFSKDFPKIKEKATSAWRSTQDMIEQKVGIEPERQKQIAKEQAKQSAQSGSSFVKRFFAGLTSTIGSLILSLVYMFLMVYNKEQFEKFFLKLYPEEDQNKVQKVVNNIATVGQKYLTGRAMSICIIAVLYSIGLSIVGIKNALLLAGIAALLTVIPYVGTVLGGLIPVLMALATEDSVQPALMAAGVLFFIQTMDNYFIEPNVVGGEVNLNALTSIFSIIVGGLMWGVAGMIIFLPLAGIIKIICDNVVELKPIGYLMGEPGPKKPSRIKLWIQEKFGKGKKNSR
jgi:predicted PurR-regulated permease PerM